MRAPLAGRPADRGSQSPPAYAVIGLGTDTGGSIRNPSTANGIVGLKPTHGLTSRDGIIPLALSFDTAGPMARSVSDVATVLGLLTGMDAADPATSKSEGHFETDYAKHLNARALSGARVGIARDFLGQDEDVDWIVEVSLEAMRRADATIVDVKPRDGCSTPKASSTMRFGIRNSRRRLSPTLRHSPRIIRRTSISSLNGPCASTRRVATERVQIPTAGRS